MNKLGVKIIILFWVALFFSHAVTAQINILPNDTIEQLIKENLIGEGIIVSNIKYKGNKLAIAAFLVNNNLLKMSEGIVLSTGNVTDIAGPNDANNKWSSNGSPGDKDLNRIGKGITCDAAILEFDFIPVKNKIVFNYMFGSEEYMEYADSKYNDVFAFVLNGPGARKKNLAVLPDHKTIVSVNNVNQFKNKQFYVNNNCWTKNNQYIKQYNSDKHNNT